MTDKQVKYDVSSSPSYSTSPLPTSSGSFPGQYDGRNPELASNAILKADGSLAFFVIDSYVFNANGDQIGELFDQDGFSMSSYGEIEIIPVPGVCNKYYVVTTNWNGDAANLDYDIGYNIVNMEISENSDADPDGFLEEDFSISLTENVAAWPKSLGTQISNLHFATTPIMNNGNRLLFITATRGVAAYEVTSEGIFYRDDLVIDFVDFLPIPGLPTNSYTQSVPSREYGQMKIIEYNGGYRMAFTATVDVFDQINAGGVAQYIQNIQLLVFDLDANGEVILTPGTLGNVQKRGGVQQPAPVNDPKPYISGIEFFNGGTSIMVNRQNAPQGKNISHYNLSTNVNGSLDLTHVVSRSFAGYENSKINKGLDGDYYLANAFGLGKITISGVNMVTSNTGTQVAFANPPVDLDFATGNSNQNTRPYYLIPNQIREDYSLRFNNPCCKNPDAVFRSHTATAGYQTWTPTNNPFNNNQEVVIYDELLFSAGSNVVITDMTFQFMPGAKVTIEEGARVRLQNSTFTVRDCEENYWQGVFVLGNPSVDHTQPQNHGRLELYNSSEISHAYRGVALYNRDNNGDILFNTSGGILQARNSTFRNNGKDVEFIPFAFDNLCTFNNCNFITDTQLPNGTASDAHVSLFGVKKVSFIGCNFENSTGSLYDNSQKGDGIRSYNSNFYIDQRCGSLTFPCPTGSQIPTTFTNLTHAVVAEASNRIYSFSMKNSHIDHCVQGVLARGVDYFVFRNNLIDLGVPVDPVTWSYGLYIQNGTGYAVEENEFIGSSAPNGNFLNYDGIIVNNSNNNGTSQDVNSVYKNSFTNVNEAVMSMNYNVGVDGNSDFNNSSGLKLKCNDFTNSGKADIGIQSSGGISPIQGSCKGFESGANNDFSLPVGFIGDFWNGTNANVSDVNYYYNFNPTGNHVPMEYNITNTNVFTCPIYYDPLEGCKSNPYGDGDLSNGDINLKILGEKTLAESLKYTLDNADNVFAENWTKAIDGDIGWGNFKNEVLVVSPYLKESNLNLLIDNSNVVPNGIVKQILINNSPLLSNSIDLLMSSALSNGIKNNIMQAQSGAVNHRISLESERYTHLADEKQFRNALIRNYVLDSTIVDGLDSLEALLSNNSDVFYKCQLVDVKIANRNFAEAQIIVDSLRNVDNGAHTQFCEFRDLL
ncbi:MAG: hypothetical protein ACI8Q1_003029, partial [Parvicella sp.]